MREPSEPIKDWFGLEVLETKLKASTVSPCVFPREQTS